MAKPPSSLVKYDAALLVSGGAADRLPTGEKPGKTQTEEILNSILPPREWTQDDGTVWMQYTSKATATRLDVINLQEMLDQRLLERQARDTGICPVREQLYTQCFDELIRHITMNSPERGLLTLRVRDEIRMTIDAYKTLYQSSVTFGVRKQLQAEQGMTEMEDTIAMLEKQCQALDNQVLELRNSVEVIEKREAEVQTLLKKKRKEEIDFLKYQGQNLDQFLKSISGGA